MRSLMTMAVVLVMTACAGTKAREEALMPAMELAWQGILPDVERVATGEVLEQAAALTVVLEERDIHGLAAIDVPLLIVWADRGISERLEAGEIGPGVAASLRERLSKFTEAYLKVIS